MPESKSKNGVFSAPAATMTIFEVSRLDSPVSLETNSTPVALGFPSGLCSFFEKRILVTVEL